MWYVGQKVARFRDSGETPPWDEEKAPPFGEAVTVRNVYTCHDGVTMLELTEYPAPETAFCYAGWMACDFRPVVTTNIDVFTAMLTRYPATRPTETV